MLHRNILTLSSFGWQDYSLKCKTTKKAQSVRADRSIASLSRSHNEEGPPRSAASPHDSQRKQTALSPISSRAADSRPMPTVPMSRCAKSGSRTSTNTMAIGVEGCCPEFRLKWSLMTAGTNGTRVRQAWVAFDAGMAPQILVRSRAGHCRSCLERMARALPEETAQTVDARDPDQYQSA